MLAGGRGSVPATYVLPGMQVISHRVHGERDPLDDHRGGLERGVDSDASGKGASEIGVARLREVERRQGSTGRPTRAIVDALKVVQVTGKIHQLQVSKSM